MRLAWLEEKFLKEAEKKKRKVGIGIMRPVPETIASLKKAEKYADLIIVGPNKIKGMNCITTKDDDRGSKKIVDLLKRGEIEGLVRGQFKDSYTHHIFCKEFGVDENKKALVTFIARGDQWLGVTSCSNYNALTYEDKFYEITRTIKFYEEDLKIKPTIAVMSTRRLTGRVGEFGLLEEIAERCEKMAKELAKKGYDVKEYYIEYEKAVWEKRNLLCPSIGIIGNPWAKSFYYIGDWHHISSPYFDQGVVYDDTARNNVDWFWPVISAVAWLNRGGVK